MKRSNLPARPYGFSLIEVLLAVVILSVGLLALAALQSSLIRASAEAKAQTSAIALANDLVEQMRAFSVTDEASCPTNPDARVSSYRCLTTRTKPTSANLADSDTVLSGAAQGRGGVSFKRWWTVARYAFSSAAGAFEVVPSTATAATLGSGTYAARQYVAGNEFKTVEVHVAWNDASGAEQEIVVRDAIGSINPADSSRVLMSTSNTNRGPQVRIRNPANEQGVIPIAVGTDNGNNQSVAATDPKPRTYGSDGNVSTRFNVQTYVADSNGFLLQKNFETAVASCNCSLRTTAPSTGVYEPSYWDGEKYSSPRIRTTSNAAIRTNVPAGVLDTSVSQDNDLCTICCRDHHDVDGPLVVNTSNPAATKAVYDPYRPTNDFTANDHNHYLRTSLSPVAFTVAAANGRYNESCRLVRVDGLFRVITDPRLENVALLNMDGGTDTVAGTLSSTAKTNYATFARTYIQDYAAALTGGSALVDFTRTPDGLAQDDPITMVGSTSVHWLTSRGIFVDWVHPETKNALACAGSTSTACTDNYPSFVNRTVEQVLPFLTVNMTNIAEWKSFATTVATVENQAIPNNSTSTYIRGLVKARSAGNADVRSMSYRGVSGLTDQQPIDPEEAAINPYLPSPGDIRRPRLYDDRGYVVANISDTDVANFSVDIANAGSDANFRAAQLNLSMTNGTCVRDGAAPTEHDCATPDGTTSFIFTFSNYNFITITCPNGGGSPRDPRDPNTVCVKNNGNESQPESVTVKEYKLCSITTPAAATVTAISASRTNTAYPDSEETRATVSAPSGGGQLDGRRFIANFYPISTVCP